MAVVTLGNVVSTFPVGTEVGAYLGATGDSGNPQPLGEVLQTATVAGDGTLEYEFPANGQTYVAAASLEKDETGADVWRVVRFSAPKPPPGLVAAEVLEQLEEHEALTTTAHGGILTKDGLEDEEATRLAADSALETLISGKASKAELEAAQEALEAALAGKQASLGYTAENAANKATSGSLGTSDTAYPSQKAVKTYVDAVKATLEAAIAEVEGGGGVTAGEVEALVDAAVEAEKLAREEAAAAHTADTTSVHGIADTSALALKSEVATDAELAAHEADTTSVHGISNTANLELTTNKVQSLSGTSESEYPSEKAVQAALEGKASTAEAEGKIAKSLVDAKGDLLVGTADNTVARKAAGSNDKILSAQSGEADGLKWVSNVDTPTHGFSILAKVEARTYRGFYVNVGSGETLKLVGMKFSIGSGTSAKFSVQQNGSSVADFKEKEAKPEAGEVTGKSVSVAAGDRFDLKVESISGTPEDIVVTLFFERTHS